MYQLFTIFSIKKRQAKKERDSYYSSHFEELKAQNAARVQMLVPPYDATSSPLMRPKTLTSLRDLHAGAIEMMDLQA